MDTAVAIAHTRRRDLLDPAPERRLVASDRPIAVRFAIEPENRAAAVLTDLVTILHPMDDLAQSARR